MSNVFYIEVKTAQETAYIHSLVSGGAGKGIIVNVTPNIEAAVTFNVFPSASDVTKIISKYFHPSVELSVKQK